MPRKKKVLRRPTDNAASVTPTPALVRRSIIDLVLRLLWIGLFVFLVAVAVSIEQKRGPAASTILAIEAASLWLAGSSGLSLSGIRSFVAWRLAAGFIFAWSLLLAGKGYWPEAGGAAVFSACSYLVSLHSAVRTRLAQRLALEGETRLPLRVPLLLGALLLTPATFLTGLTLGLPALLATGALRLSPFTLGAATLGMVLAVPLAISSYRLERRWLVVAPRGLIVHDPFLFSSTLRIPPQTVEYAEPPQRRWRWSEADRATLLHLGAGAFSNPILLRLHKPIEAPQPRHVGPGTAFPPAGYVTLIATYLSEPDYAYRILATAGYARPGEFSRLEAEGTQPLTRGVP